MEVVTCERCEAVGLGVGTLCIDCRCDDKKNGKPPQEEQKKMEQDKLDEGGQGKAKRIEAVACKAKKRKTVDTNDEHQECDSQRKQKKENIKEQHTSSDSDAENSAPKSARKKHALGHTKTAQHTSTKEQIAKGSSEQGAEENDSSHSQDERPLMQHERKATHTEESTMTTNDDVAQNEDKKEAHSRGNESAGGTYQSAELEGGGEGGCSWLRGQWRGWTGRDWYDDEAYCERQAGERVRVEGLKAQEFNGLLGTLKGGSGGGRLRVLLDKYQDENDEWHEGKILSRSCKSENLVLIKQAPRPSPGAPGSTVACRAARRAALFGTEFVPKKKKTKLGKREREAEKAKQLAANKGSCA